MCNVLIVDDETAIADLIEMTLEPFGYRCVKAYTGEQAADCIGAASFDLILLDVIAARGGWLCPDGVYRTHRHTGHLSYGQNRCGGPGAGAAGRGL